MAQADGRLSNLTIRNVRPLGGAVTDIHIRDGLFAASADNAVIVDGGGALLLAGLIEGHTHLDKTTWGAPWHRNTIGPTRAERIAHERDWRGVTNHDAAARSLDLARAFLANGTTRMRAHADIDPSIGLRHVRATQRTREVLAGIIDMQVVAFPQSGIVCQNGVADLMDAALAEGADVVGGIDPCSIDRDPVRHLDVVFGLAIKHAKPVDIHLHESGEMGAFSLDLILERTEALGLRGQVTISHGFCLGTLPVAERDTLLTRMARVDMRIATTAPAGIPVPTLAACRAAGVTIYGGNDGVRDSWTPYGEPDMLDRAMHIGLRNGLRRDDELAWALECVTSAAAVGCGFANYGLTPGCRADLVLVDAETVAEAIIRHPPRRLVVAGGRIVVRDGVLLV